jgi:hypothetical protein
MSSNIAKIVQELVEKIKWDEVEDPVEMKVKLSQLLSNRVYNAPEQEYIVFEELDNILQKYLGKPDAAWKKEIINIIRK